MSPVLVHAERRRLTARIALTITVAIISTLVLFSGGPNGPLSFAQQTTSPGPTITWLNPDADTSNEISAKSDTSGGTTDGTYHLVSTVSALPPNPAVTFQYQSGEDPPQTIGQATQVGDAFHYNWSAGTAPGSMPADAEYTLIAILFSGGNEVSRDTEEVVVNNEDEELPVADPRENASETVEITEPTLGDRIGFYDPPGSSRYTTSIRVKHSADTSFLDPYYTISRPGTEPTWTDCGGESSTGDEDWVRCELTGTHTPPEVTGVAVVARHADAPSPAPSDEESGDAHRVFGYDANPTTVTLSGAGGQQTVGTCTAPIIATVTDQDGNRVVGVNMDVHAQGPNDSLAFDDNDSSGNTSSANKAPENHPTQPARDCETETEPPADGAQGWHEDGAVDRKHIESTTGTGDDGTWSFKLFSSAAGTTQYTVWADEDGNDRLCSLEAQKDGSLGWGQAAPTVTGTADDEGSCVEPTPTDRTQSPSTNTTTPVSESPTSASPTTASPTSASPSPSSSTTSASPTPTETTTPPPDKRTPVASSVTGKATKKGFNGQVISAKKKCEKGRLVKIKKAGKGVIGKDRTNKAGNWKLKRPNANGRFHAVVTPKKFTNKQGQRFKCTRDRSPFFRR